MSIYYPEIQSINLIADYACNKLSTFSHINHTQPGHTVGFDLDTFLWSSVTWSAQSHSSISLSCDLTLARISLHSQPGQWLQSRPLSSSSWGGPAGPARCSEDAVGKLCCSWSKPCTLLPNSVDFISLTGFTCFGNKAEKRSKQCCEFKEAINCCIFMHCHFHNTQGIMYNTTYLSAQACRNVLYSSKRRTCKYSFKGNQFLEQHLYVFYYRQLRTMRQKDALKVPAGPQGHEGAATWEDKMNFSFRQDNE